MTPKITSEDTHHAWQEVQEEDCRRRAENRRYCAHLDDIGASKAWEQYVESQHRIITVKPLTSETKEPE